MRGLVLLSVSLTSTTTSAWLSLAALSLITGTIRGLNSPGMSVSLEVWLAIS